MLKACVKGFTLNKYNPYEVVGSGYKYIHYDLIDK